jgi:hypothetical protein
LNRVLFFVSISFRLRMDAGPDLPVLSEKTINLAHTIDQYNRCRGMKVSEVWGS